MNRTVASRKGTWPKSCVPVNSLNRWIDFIGNRNIQSCRFSRKATVLEAPSALQRTRKRPTGVKFERLFCTKSNQNGSADGSMFSTRQKVKVSGNFNPYANSIFKSSNSNKSIPKVFQGTPQASSKVVGPNTGGGNFSSKYPSRKSWKQTGNQRDTNPKFVAGGASESSTPNPRIAKKNSGHRGEFSERVNLSDIESEVALLEDSESIVDPIATHMIKPHDKRDESSQSYGKHSRKKVDGKVKNHRRTDKGSGYSSVNRSGGDGKNRKHEDLRSSKSAKATNIESEIGSTAEFPPDNSIDLVNNLENVKPVKIVVSLPQSITVKELSMRSNVKSIDIIDELITKGEIEVDSQTSRTVPHHILNKLRIHARGRKSRLINQEVSYAADCITISADAAEAVLKRFDLTVEREANADVDELPTDHELAILSEVPGLKERPPIVTVMGHVDHGKTTLLDRLRNTSVAAREAGGITQAVGAFQFVLNDNAITFIDTPGHEAFAGMRKSGSLLTDIVVLVISCTDGVRSQTIESAQLAKAAQVPIIVAMSKIDTPAVNVDEARLRISEQLKELDVITEDFGGNVQMVPIAAPKGIGLETLSDAIILQASEMNLLAVPETRGEAIVLESQIDKAMGHVADVVLRWGTLKTGDNIVCNEQACRIRQMLDTVTGKPVKKAGPSFPVRLVGFDETPQPGSDVLAVRDAKQAKKVSSFRARRREATEQLISKREHDIRAAEERTASHLRKLTNEKRRGKYRRLNNKQNEKVAEDTPLEAIRVPVILKAATDGSMDALRYSVDAISAELQEAAGSVGLSEDSGVAVVRRSVGEVTTSDIEAAKAAKAVVYAFSVRVPSKVANLARQYHVRICSQSVIYHLLDDLKANVREKGPRRKVPVVSSSALVLKVFTMQPRRRSEGVWTVAGCRVDSGTIKKSERFRVRRGDEVIYEGGLDSLRIFKDDVSEVVKGKECGISLSGFQDFQEGDFIETFSMEEKLVV